MSVPLNEKISTVLSLLKKPRLLNALISLKHSGYLVESGWINSYEKKEPLDMNNNPLPWITFSCIQFLQVRLNKNLTIFEYGAGNSTLFYAGRTREVTAVEHSEDWFNKLKKIIPENVLIIYKQIDVDGDYCRAAVNSGKKYDIIIDDAEDRINCIYQSINTLTENGVFILDDSERPEYKEGINYLLNNNFRNLDFWGMAPGVLFNKCTTIFYKPGNCLNI